MYFMVCMRPNHKSDWFLFDEGKIITAELPYKDADYMNKKIHDTHFKSTKKNRLFPESRELGISDKEAKNIMQQMREVLRCAYDVYKPHIASTRESKYGFEVFGCDFMITDDYKVKLSELSLWELEVDEVSENNKHLMFNKNFLPCINDNGKPVQFHVFETFILIKDDISNLMISFEQDFSDHD